MDYYTIYSLGFIATVGLFAIRARDVESRTLFLIAITWPLSMSLALFIYALSLVDADMDVKDSDKVFGFRKSPNPAVKGFAVTIFYSEIQFWKKV